MEDCQICGRNKPGTYCYACQPALAFEDEEEECAEEDEEECNGEEQNIEEEEVEISDEDTGEEASGGMGIEETSKGKGKGKVEQVEEIGKGKGKSNGMVTMMDHTGPVVGRRWRSGILSPHANDDDTHT